MCSLTFLNEVCLVSQRHPLDNVDGPNYGPPTKEPLLLQRETQVRSIRIYIIRTL